MIFLLLFTVILVCIFKAKRSTRANRWCIPLVCCLLLILVAGLRTDYGNDFKNYVIHWSEINSIKDVLASTFDKGYSLMAFLFKRMGLGIHTFMLTVAFVSIASKYKFMNEVSPLPIVSWIMYYLMFYIVNDMEQIRHGLAIGICFFAIKYVLKREPLKFFSCVLLACTFHTTAIFFLAVYILPNIVLTIKGVAFISLCTAAVSCIDLMKILAVLNTSFLHSSRIQEKIQLYINSSTTEVLSLTLVLRIVVFMLFWIFSYDRKDRLHRLLLNGYLLGICIFAGLHSVEMMAVRASVFFRYFELAMIPIYITSIPHIQQRVQRFPIWQKIGCRCRETAGRKTGVPARRLLGVCMTAKPIHYTVISGLFAYYLIKFIEILFSFHYFAYLSA